MKKILIRMCIIIAVLSIAVIGAFLLRKEYRQAKANVRAAECEIIPGIICIGDSLTQGTDGNYPQYLEEHMIEDCIYLPVFNLGIGGETTITIAGRLGGVPFRVNAFDIPEDDRRVPIAIYEDEIHDIRLFEKPGRDAVNPVVIAGTMGELSLDEDENQYYFTRIFDDEELTESQFANIASYKWDDKAEYYTVETAGQTRYQDGIYIVFMGENGGFADIDELIMQQRAILNKQTLNKDKYLIIGMTTGDAASRKELEDAMACEYGDKYINLRAYFTGTDVNAIATNNNTYKRCMTGDVIKDAAKYGVTFSEKNLADMELGIVPECLRGDDIHYNNAGYRLLADLVYERMLELGYYDEVNELSMKYRKIWGAANALEFEVNNK